MKKLLIATLIVLCPAVLFAQTYCQWSGTEGENCRTLPTDVNFIRVPPDNHAISIDAANLEQHGYYELIVTQPTVGVNQIIDTVVWGFANNEISKTWTVRDLTTEEINNKIASPMSVTNYYIWKALIATGTITIQQAQDNLPQELIDAYQARKTLLGD
jgi:hypothetical protein